MIKFGFLKLCRNKLYFTESPADQTFCPSGWVKLVSSCYYFSTYKTTWSKARSSCQKLGGNLTASMSNKENYAIWNVAKQKSLCHSFIGLVRHSDKKFCTVKGIKPSYTNCALGEPNDPDGEQCGHYLVNNNKWSDVSCSNNYHFICQKPLMKCWAFYNRIFFIVCFDM